jgi:hypothetical protein
VCPSSGAAFCQPSQEQQTQAAAAQQQKTAQINALTAAYNSQLNALEQQAVNIKTKYYSDVAALQGQGGGMAFLQGETQKLTNDANTQIAQIQLQEGQLLANYNLQISELQ